MNSSCSSIVQSIPGFIETRSKTHQGFDQANEIDKVFLGFMVYGWPVSIETQPD